MSKQMLGEFKYIFTWLVDNRPGIHIHILLPSCMFPSSSSSASLKWCCCLVTKSCASFYDPLDCQAPPSMGFSRQENWSGLVFPSPGALSEPGIKPRSPALAGTFFLCEPPYYMGNFSWIVRISVTFRYNFYIFEIGIQQSFIMPSNEQLSISSYQLDI